MPFKESCGAIKHVGFVCSAIAMTSMTSVASIFMGLSFRHGLRHGLGLGLRLRLGFGIITITKFYVEIVETLRVMIVIVFGLIALLLVVGI